MKKLVSRIAIIAAAMLGASAVYAADLPSKKAPVYPDYSVAPIYWGGAFVGVNAGYGWNVNNGGSGSFTGGGQLGYNYQTGPYVLGVETDIQYADIQGRWAGSNSGYFGTIRGRAGYAIDRWLPYVTAGAAYGTMSNLPLLDNSVRWGWTVGGGVEYALTSNWSARLEGLYLNIPRPAIYGGATETGVVRAGVNYRF